jgi:hypothetical protein
MRRRLLAGFLVLFGLWFLWKGLPFLRADRPDTYATPTVQPDGPAALSPIGVKKHQQACLDQIPFGPDARYVQFTLTGSKYPSAPITIVASGPGYHAETRVPAGTPGNVLQTVALPAASRTITSGTLCFRNEGRHELNFYGVAPGRGESPSTTTVAGAPVPQDFSVTLLRSPARPLGARLATLSSHLAAFRPLTGWEVWLLGLLAIVGVPIAVAVALARAAALDDRDGEDGADPPPAGW